ncbi:MAG: hypothetical protein VX798_17015 [Bacteroidota bacterium]|nr:hypothetical protein [Bacteroidota bacterium]
MLYLNRKIGFVVIAISLLMGCTSNSQIIKVGGEHDYTILRGPVKKSETNTYEPFLKNGDIVRGKLLNDLKKISGSGGVKEFDKEGNLIRAIQYNVGSKNPEYYNEYEYSNGNLMKTLGYKTPSKDVKLSKQEFRYDSNNRVFVEKNFTPSYCENKEWLLTGKYVFKYNENDNVITQIDSSFVPYDCDDIRIRARVIDYHHKYDNGVKIEDDTFLYKYDSDGNLIKKTDKNSPTIYYEYYPSGIRKKEYLSPDNYDEFNEDGYYKKRVIALRAGDEYTFEYDEYDEYGNWTQMIIYEDGTPYLIGERKITYYE